jgi:hypothetical protein
MQKKQKERVARMPATTYLLQADDEVEADEWIDAMNEAAEQGVEASLGKALRPREHAAQLKKDSEEEEIKRRTRRRSRTGGGQPWSSALMKAMRTLAEAEARRSVQLQTLRHTLVQPCAMVLGLSSHLLTADDLVRPSSEEEAEGAAAVMSSPPTDHLSTPALKRRALQSLDLPPKADALSLSRERSFIGLESDGELDLLEGCACIKEVSTICACLRVLSVLNIQLRTGLGRLSKELDRACTEQKVANRNGTHASKDGDGDKGAGGIAFVSVAEGATVAPAAPAGPLQYHSPSPEALCAILRGLLSLLLSVSPFVAPYLRLVVHYHATLSAIAPIDNGDEQESASADGGTNPFATAVREAQTAIDGAAAADTETRQIERDVAGHEAMRQMLGSAATHLVDRAGEVSAIVRAASAAAHEATTTRSNSADSDASSTAAAAAAATEAAKRKFGSSKRLSLFRTTSRDALTVKKEAREKDGNSAGDATLKSVYSLLKQLQRVGSKFCADAELVARTAEQQHKVRELGDMQQMFGDQLELCSRDTLDRITPSTRYSSLAATSYMSQRDSFIDVKDAPHADGAHGEEEAWKQRMQNVGLGLGPDGTGAGAGVVDGAGLDPAMQPGGPIRQCRELLRSSTLMVIKDKSERSWKSRAVRPFRSGTKARLRRFFLFNDLLVYGHMTLNGSCVIHGSFALVGCRILNLDDLDPEYMAMQRHQTQDELSQGIRALEEEIKSKMQQHSTGASIGTVVALPPELGDHGRKHSIMGVNRKRSNSKKDGMEGLAAARAAQLATGGDGGSGDGSDGVGMDSASGDGGGSSVLGVNPNHVLSLEPTALDAAIASAMQQDRKSSRMEQLSRMVRKKRGSSPGGGAGIEMGMNDEDRSAETVRDSSGSIGRESELDMKATDGAFENMVVELENPLMQLEKLRLMQEQMDLKQAREQQREEEKQERRQKQHQPWQQPSLEVDLAQMNRQVTSKEPLVRSGSEKRDVPSSPIKHAEPGSPSEPGSPLALGSPSKAASPVSAPPTKAKMMWGLLKEAVRDMTEDKQEELAFMEQQQQDQEQMRAEAASKRRDYVMKQAKEKGNGRVKGGVRKDGEQQEHGFGGMGGSGAGDSAAEDGSGARPSPQSVTQVVRKMTVEAGSIGDFVTMLNEGKTGRLKTLPVNAKLGPTASFPEKGELNINSRGKVVVDGARKKSTVEVAMGMLHIGHQGKSKRRSTNGIGVTSEFGGGAHGNGDPPFGLEIVDSKTGRRLKTYAASRDDQQEWLVHLTESIAQAEKGQRQRQVRQKWLMLQQQKAVLLEERQEREEREREQQSTSPDVDGPKKKRASLNAAQQQVLGVMRQFGPGGGLHVPSRASSAGASSRKRTGSGSSGSPPSSGGLRRRSSGAGGSPENSSSSGGMKRRQSVKLTIMSGDTHTKGSIVELEHLDMSTLGVLEGEWTWTWGRRRRLSSRNILMTLGRRWMRRWRTLRMRWRQQAVKARLVSLMWLNWPWMEWAVGMMRREHGGVRMAMGGLCRRWAHQYCHRPCRGRLLRREHQCPKSAVRWPR